MAKRRRRHVFDAEPDLGGLLAGVLLYERAGKLELRVALERAREDQFGVLPPSL